MEKIDNLGRERARTDLWDGLRCKAKNKIVAQTKRPYLVDEQATISPVALLQIKNNNNKKHAAEFCCL